METTKTITSNCIPAIETRFDTWSLGNFLIGPEGESVRWTRGQISHLDVLKMWPNVYNGAVKYSGGMYGVSSTDKMCAALTYEWIYSLGFVRGGYNGVDRWVAFNSSKVSDVGLMKILQLARNSGVEYFDVDDGVLGWFYKNMMVDEFIEKFM